ncbi:MAG: HD domain-containing protein [Treponema sp.]|jgi:HD superfamily phosphohydrolase|nr:HD domain-containing protein [Treponema sp.]
MKDTVYAALEQGFTAPVRDVLWGHIYLTPGMEALATSAPFMRLHRIFQLGPAYCVYPGATHTRAAHSIGVYHLARRILRNFAERGADAWISPVGVRSFLAAALLHDLGHFPYTHSLKELPLEDHEALTGKIIMAEPVKSLVADTGADPYLTAGIIDTDMPGDDEKELLFYRKLLSGVLDPDKLDYLNRDARYCGVPYGAQDVDFILSRLHPHCERGIDIDSRAIPSVESVLFSKYLMYRTVYWHPAVRSATAMIKKALLGGLENRSIAQEELYNLDDQSLFTLMAHRKDPLFALGDKVRDGCLYTTAAEFSYNETLHRELLDIANRSSHEETLAAELSDVSGIRLFPHEVIIDIPEPITFETGLYVTDKGCYFERSSGVFKGETVDSFIKSLHTIRIFIDPVHKKWIRPDSAGHNSQKLNPKLYDILHIKKNWL